MGWGHLPPQTTKGKERRERERERDPHHELAIQFMVCSAQDVPRKEGGVLAIFWGGLFRPVCRPHVRFLPLKGGKCRPFLFWGLFRAVCRPRGSRSTLKQHRTPANFSFGLFGHLFVPKLTFRVPKSIKLRPETVICVGSRWCSRFGSIRFAGDRLAELVCGPDGHDLWFSHGPDGQDLWFSRGPDGLDLWFSRGPDGLGLWFSRQPQILFQTIVERVLFHTIVHGTRANEQLQAHGVFQANEKLQAKRALAGKPGSSRQTGTFLLA